MLDNIYKEMIEDSPLAYIHIKIIRDENLKLKKVKVEYANKSYKILIRDKYNKSLFSSEIKNVEEKIEWEEIFEKAIKNRKHSITRYIEGINSYFNIEIYNIKNDEFYIRFNKINKQTMKLSSIIKNSPFIAWLKDRNGRYIDVNDTYMEKFKIKYEDIIGKTDYDLFSNEIAIQLIKEDEDVIRNNTLYTSQIKEFLVNEEKKYFETSKWAYTDNDNTILGTIGIGSERTDTVKLMNSIRENEKRFLEITNNIDDIIIIQDHIKAHYISPSFEKIYGFKPDALYEDMKNWYKHWDSIEFEEEPVDYSYEGTDTCTFKVSKAGQDDIWMFSKFAPLFDEQGNITKKIGILSDITKQKEKEAHLEKLRMDFFANLSHELRTPINLIQSCLQVLDLKLDKLDGEIAIYFDKYLSIINQNGMRLLKLVNNLIDTTKIDAGHFDYNPKNKDIVSCVEDICMSVSSFVENNNLQIIFDTDIEEKTISFDQDNMERIILNLISNAIKFNNPGGKIEVSIICDENVTIKVKDTGIGIPIEKQETVFGRFEQVKDKFKKEREGSGIGLSLVKSLVEIHDGSICLNSVVDEGSEFIITLPDRLINEENEIQENNTYLSNTNRMQVEFSDIYK